MYPKCYHAAQYSPKHFEDALLKACDKKTQLLFELEPLIRNGFIYGTQGFVINPETENMVYIYSDQESPYRVQIEYRYVRCRDPESGGLNRHGETPESIAPEIVRMLKETNRSQRDFELNFCKKGIA